MEKKPAGGATDPQSVSSGPVRVKKENDEEYTEDYKYNFNVIFSDDDSKEYTVDGDEPCTVLEAIKSTFEHYEKKIKGYSDENIIIQLGKADKELTIPTHFPSSCISPGESLIIHTNKKIEGAKDQQNNMVHSKDRYSVFYIDTIGGQNTKTKTLFRNSDVKEFKYLCVYGEKGMTVAEALKRDGRFIDDLGDFTLSDNENPKSTTLPTKNVEYLDQKKFKICLPRNTESENKKQQKTSGTAGSSKHRCDSKAASEQRVAHQRGMSVREAVTKADSAEERQKIYEILRQQFPDLKKLMESRFPGDSYQKALELKKENFGKIQQSFSEVHRVRKLLKLGESVCKVVIKNGSEGSGFVLFDNLILTNAHLFIGCVDGGRLKEGISVFALFNYDDPDEEQRNYYKFKVQDVIGEYREEGLDYAVLELNPEGQESRPTTETKETKVPPGLLEKCGPIPPNGEACIIGHPAGEVKKMDPTCIIEEEKREQAASDHLRPYKDHAFILHSVIDQIRAQGIDKIMTGGNRADTVVTYDTFMYHGSSGSPVFDADCRVFGLHTAGYVYGSPTDTESVIEFAQPLLTIFEDFVSKLEKSGNEDVLQKFKEHAKRNEFLKKNLGLVDDDEPMETAAV